MRCDSPPESVIVNRSSVIYPSPIPSRKRSRLRISSKIRLATSSSYFERRISWKEPIRFFNGHPDNILDILFAYADIEYLPSADAIRRIQSHVV